MLFLFLSNTREYIYLMRSKSVLSQNNQKCISDRENELPKLEGHELSAKDINYRSIYWQIIKERCYLVAKNKWSM